MLNSQATYTECAMYGKSLLLGIVKDLHQHAGDALIEISKKYRVTINLIKNLVNTLSKAQRIEMLEKQQQTQKQEPQQEVILPEIRFVSQDIIKQAKDLSPMKKEMLTKKFWKKHKMFTLNNEKEKADAMYAALKDKDLDKAMFLARKYGIHFVA